MVDPGALVTLATPRDVPRLEVQRNRLPVGATSTLRTGLLFVDFPLGNKSSSAGV